MIKRSTHIQADPLSTWEIHMPEVGAAKGRALAAYDENGKTINWDTSEFDGNKLIINFGIDPVSGSLDYEYQTDEQELNNNASLVNIANNYGGIQVSPNTFRQA